MITACATQADPPAQPKAIIDRAIAAHGGAASLARFPAITWKGAGKFHGNEPPADYQAVGARQRGEQALLGVDINVNGARLRLVRTINGDRAWQETNDRVQPVPTEQLAEEKERLHAQWVASLVPLLDGKYQLSSVPACAVADRPADGVRIRFTGHRDLTLFFDRQTGLLAKKETHVVDVLHTKKEVLQETYYEHYRLISGVQVPCRTRLDWNGKPYIDQEMIEVRLYEKLPEHMFLRPELK